MSLNEYLYRNDTRHEIPPPLIKKQRLEKQTNRFIPPKPVITYEFFALSDGCKKVITENDGLSVEGNPIILNPDTVSYINLFINGVLQPKMNYKIEQGRIILKTEDVPIYGTPIILQMVIVSG